MRETNRPVPAAATPWEALAAAFAFLREGAHWGSAETLHRWRKANLPAPERFSGPGASRKAVTAAAAALADAGHDRAAAALAAWRDSQLPAPGTRSGHRWREHWESEDIDDPARRFDEQCEHCGLALAYISGGRPEPVPYWTWPDGRRLAATGPTAPPCPAPRTEPKPALKKEVSLCSS
ncbi:hypothetical protein [Glycomyces sp. NPDC048151]|uniref:hypothetical protein n=1 Tax=Glycomyces sp. NPDC048151 TaxID=3364002 RepID=UPI0037226AC7